MFMAARVNPTLSMQAMVYDISYDRILMIYRICIYRLVVVTEPLGISYEKANHGC